MESLRRAIILWNCARFADEPGVTFRVARPATVAIAETWLAGSRSALVLLGMSESAAARVIALRKAGVDERELDRAAECGASVLLPGEDGYPTDLARHGYAPAPLYVRGAGAARLGQTPRIAIVGSRAASRERIMIAEDLGRASAAARVPVVSGLALGVDAAAHRGVFDGGGLPIGVVGCGVDRVYPPRTAREHRQVLERGVLMSPFPLGADPRAWHFLMRNRIIAALAGLVVVVAAGERSGSLSTASAALACGVEVAAVPGSPLDPLAIGSNRLIRDGAIVVLEPQDALEALLGFGAITSSPGFGERRPAIARVDDATDRRLLEALDHDRASAEELAVLLDLPLAEVVERLVALELDGQVSCAPGRLYSRER